MIILNKYFNSKNRHINSAIKNFFFQKSIYTSIPFDEGWKVYSNNKEITNVTITRDNDARNYNQGDCYMINGEEINHMPRDELLTLKGNPIIESYKFDQYVCNKLLNNLIKEIYKS